MNGSFRNQDGTYNGIALLAAMSGLEQREVQWTADRIRQLMVVEKRPREEAVATVTEECKGKSWLK
jgi:hypothetical protein